MPLAVNLHHLEAHNLELQGELPVAELDLQIRDELIRAEEPLHYDLEVQKLDHDLLVQGTLRLTLQCQCVRCLRPVRHTLQIDPWTRDLPLQGEDKVPVINDCVDLTPLIREDILLEFPQHPLCEADCRGLPATGSGKADSVGAAGSTGQDSSAWAELDKLKL